MEQSPLSLRLFSLSHRPSPQAFDRTCGEDDVALGFECADPARQIDAWLSETRSPVLQDEGY